MSQVWLNTPAHLTKKAALGGAAIREQSRRLARIEDQYAFGSLADQKFTITMAHFFIMSRTRGS
jgi:hypothetical protein